MSSDITVNAYVQLDGLSVGDTVNLNWYGPDNNIDATSTFIATSGSACFFTDLSVAQFIAPIGFGAWQIQVVVNRHAIGSPLGFQVNSVAPIQPNLTLATSPNPSLVGQTVTLTAMISPAFLSGMVTFFDGAIEIGAANLMNGSATFKISYLAAGNHALTVFYAGDNLNYTPVLSTPVNQLVNLPGSQIATITVSGGTPQSTAPGTGFPNPLQVTVTDSAANPVSGIAVTFTAPSSGASAILSSGTALTNALGVASVTAMANNISGGYIVTASAGTLSASFFLTNGPNNGPIDLALGKFATQSSTFPGYATAGAASAVDGNTDGNFSDGSVTATNLDANPWWQVDLGASSPISSIVIWNRTDCCASRLSDYWVFVSDTPFLPTDTPGTLQFRPGTFSSHQTTAPNPSTTIAASTQGRYVRVQLTFANYLSLAEVQVFGPATQPIDLAQAKPATQSSTLPGYATAGAGSAVDGNTDGIFFDGSVTATNSDPNAWWQVDLGASASISSIAVWNRTDCCSSRLSDYWVFVSDTPFGPTDTPANLQFRAGTWSSHQMAIPNPSIIIASGAQGRYVRVQLSGTNYLSLAEVQVFGTLSSPSGSNLAVGKAAGQSSTLPGYATAGAGSAVDGNPDGAFFDGSVTATNFDPNAWWQVDLGRSASVSSIVIWNRTDCCSSRLSDYWVFVSDTPFSPTDTPANLQFRAGTWSSHQMAIPNPSVIIAAGAQGRYVRVQLSGTNYLSLAEVQVWGQ
ncbi:MAG TPA: discoidin domain-containing protein [Bryobacteraceae bacterium]|nr:discoidin domain-containing protein [Bryobacteraceae bacterium]